MKIKLIYRCGECADTTERLVSIPKRPSDKHILTVDDSCALCQNCIDNLDMGDEQECPPEPKVEWVIQ